MGVLLTLEEYRDFFYSDSPRQYRFPLLPIPKIEGQVADLMEGRSEGFGLWIGQIAPGWAEGLSNEVSLQELWYLNSKDGIEFKRFLVPDCWLRFAEISKNDASLLLFTMESFDEIPLEVLAEVLLRSRAEGLFDRVNSFEKRGSFEQAEAFLTRFAELVKGRSAEEVNEIVWAFLNPPYLLSENLRWNWFDEDMIESVVRAMIHPFRDWLNCQPHDVHDTGFHMWWDGVIPYKNGWESPKCVLEVLSQTLDLDHPSCVGAALHGINHLGTREDREAVLLPYFKKKRMNQAEQAKYEHILSGSCM